jgi:hypothetical protein
MQESEKTPTPSAERDESAIRSIRDESHVASRDGPADDEQIRMRAYELYRERGGKVGDDMADWLKAEGEYRAHLARAVAVIPVGQRTSASAAEANRA